MSAAPSVAQQRDPPAWRAAILAALTGKAAILAAHGRGALLRDRKVWWGEPSGRAAPTFGYGSVRRGLSRRDEAASMDGAAAS